MASGAVQGNKQLSHPGLSLLFTPIQKQLIFTSQISFLAAVNKCTVTLVDVMRAHWDEFSPYLSKELPSAFLGGHFACDGSCRVYGWISGVEQPVE